jgi:hypothetical protein
MVPTAPTFCNRCSDALEEGCDPWDELSELNHDALLERHRLKIIDLKRNINQSHSPIIRQLSPDVTSIIFEFCLPDFGDHQLSPTTEEDHSIPLSLGAICSYWRDIAWSTPCLWSSLVLRVTSNHDSHIAGMAQEWLARSGQLPLSIRIFSELDKSEAVSTLANIINQYSTRWSDLDLFIPDRYYQHFHATDDHAPILKSVRFHCSDNPRPNAKFQLTCPRLERASLSCVQLDGINIHWDGLTHLTLHSIPIVDSFLILRETPRLVFCKVSGSSSPHEEPSIGAPVLTSMRSLQLITSFPEIFLNKLIAPQLEEFGLPNYFNLSVKVITSFLRRSACSLRSFSVILPPYFEDFMNLLQSMPSLSILLITTTNYYRYFPPEYYEPRNLLQLVAKVLYSQSTSLQQGFLPNLKILEYTGLLYLRPGNYEDLYSLPPADNAVHPLHLLKLDLHPVTRLPKNMISYLSSLVERGVTVDVSSDSEDILQSSINYYWCRKDSLCRDWTDNFDWSFFPWVISN